MSSDTPSNNYERNRFYKRLPDVPRQFSNPPPSESSGAFTNNRAAESFGRPPGRKRYSDDDEGSYIKKGKRIKKSSKDRYNFF